jgi:hypothetical protein
MKMQKYLLNFTKRMVLSGLHDVHQHPLRI